MIYSIKWLAQIFTEADGNGGKGSFSRVFGGTIIITILRMAWIGKIVPEQLMTMFWVLVGYQMLSKALNTMSPAVLDIARSYMLKAGVKIETNDPKH